MLRPNRLSVTLNAPQGEINRDKRVFRNIAKGMEKAAYFCSAGNVVSSTM